MTVRFSLAPAATVLSAAALAVALPLIAGGCGRSSEKSVVATVGPRKITLGYYESKLVKLKPQDLPLDDRGMPVDTATMEGKRTFLDVIINKELMALKAEELGIGADQQVVAAAQSIREFNAPVVMLYDLVEKPANTVTEAELQEYYQNLQTQRRLSFIICDFADDAAKAREALREGGLWEDVADEYNIGSRGPNNDYTLTVQWGRLEDSFERAIWSLKEGEISEPVPTVYGYWVLRLNAVEPVKVQPLESMKDVTLTSIRQRKINLARRAFLDESRRKHDFKLDENALWTIFQKLPEREILLDPVTRKPTPREQLQPLAVPTEDLDKFLLQVRLGDKFDSWTIGDYKQMFDAMNVFERPKRHEMLAGLRQKILSMIDRKLLLQEAKERGYMDDPRVTGDTEEKREQMMVTKLHEQVVTVDERVTPEEFDAFWNEHLDEFSIKETRTGKAVICADQKSALDARAAAEKGTEWTEILTRYGSDQDNKKSGGNMQIERSSPSPLRDMVFSMKGPGEVSQPLAIPQGWVVVRLDSIGPQRPVAKHEASAAIGQYIKNERREQKLKDLLAEWRASYPVKVRENVLAKARSHAELIALPQPENPLRKAQVY